MVQFAISKTPSNSVKPGDWVLITNNAYKAFEEGYNGSWTRKHHKMVGKLMKVQSVDSCLPASNIITCYIPSDPRTFMEFPSQCVEKLDDSIPDGWCPARIQPMDKTTNIFIGLTREGFLPVFVCWINNEWTHYYPLSRPNKPIDIIAYQPIPNWSKNWPK